MRIVLIAVYPVWFVYLLSMVHVVMASSFVLVAGLDLSTSVVSTSALEAANITLSMPVNVWIGPSANTLAYSQSTQLILKLF